MALKGPGSLVVDVCSIGVVYLIHHTSYHGLNRFEARDYVFHQMFSMAVTIRGVMYKVHYPDTTHVNNK
jgi:hypothetical protein